MTRIEDNFTIWFPHPSNQPSSCLPPKFYFSQWRRIVKKRTTWKNLIPNKYNIKKQSDRGKKSQFEIESLLFFLTQSSFISQFFLKDEMIITKEVLRRDQIAINHSICIWAINYHQHLLFFFGVSAKFPLFSLLILNSCGVESGRKKIRKTKQK